MNIIKNFLRWARISKAGDDSQQLPVQQTDYLGKVADSVILFPYGYHANLTPDSLVALFSVQGQNENRVAIGYDPVGRPKLESGEIAIFHPGSGSLIKLSADGTISITAPEIELKGNVTIAGDLTVQGDTMVKGITSNGANISNSHVHSGVSTGSSNTGPPV